MMEPPNKLSRKARKRRLKEMRQLVKMRSLVEINASSTSVENGRSNSASDYARPVASNSSPYSPQPIWRPKYFAGIHSDPRFYSSFPPDGEISSPFGDTCEVTFCNDENRQANLPLQQEEPKSTNVWKPTGDLLKNEEQYARDMKILYDYTESNHTGPDNGHDSFFDALRRLSIDYIQCLLKERDRLKCIGSLNSQFSCSFFIMERLDSLLNLFRIANGAIGISKMQQDALISSEKVLEGVKSQLTDYNAEYVDISSVSPPPEVPSPRFSQELEEARNEVNMLLEQLTGTQNELEKVKNDQIDKQKNLVAKLLEIRASLAEKNQCSELVKKSFMERVNNIEEITFDINKLINDNIQFKDNIKSKEVPITAHSSKVLNVTEYEVHLVTMLSSYLKAISFSVNLDFIYSYVEKIDNSLSKEYVECLLKKYPTFFQEESIGAGSGKEHWKYLELKPIITI